MSASKPYTDQQMAKFLYFEQTQAEVDNRLQMLAYVHGEEAKAYVEASEAAAVCKQNVAKLEDDLSTLKHKKYVFYQSEKGTDDKKSPTTDYIKGRVGSDSEVLALIDKIHILTMEQVHLDHRAKDGHYRLKSIDILQANIEQINRAMQKERFNL